MVWMQDESAALPEWREIYKNLRSLKGHELPGVINVALVQPKCVLSGDLHVRLPLFVGQEVEDGLISQEDTQVAKIISGGSGDDGIA